MASARTNYLLSAAYQILTLIVPFLTTPYLSRVLGANAIGVYSYTNSLSYYFLLFAMMGVTTYGNRAIAQVRNDRTDLSCTFWGIYYFQLASSLLSTTVYLFVALNAPNPTISLIWVIYVLSAAFDVSWFFFGLEEFKIAVSRNCAIKVGTTFLIFILVKHQSDLPIYALLTASSFIITQLALWPFLLRRIDIQGPRWIEIRRHIKPNLVLFVPTIAMSLYTTTSKVLLGTLNSMAETAYFENTEKIVRMPLSLVTALGSVMLPRMSYLLQSGDHNKANHYYDLSMWFALTLACGLAFGLAAVSDCFTPVFFGEEFNACAPLIKMLSINSIIMAWSNVHRTQYLIPRGMDRAYVIAIVGGAAANVLLCIMLAPVIGAWGAVFSSIVAEACALIIQILLSSTMRDQLTYIKYLLVAALAGIGMYLPVSCMAHMYDPSIGLLIGQIVVGVLSYFLLTVLFNVIFRNSEFLYFARRLPLINRFGLWSRLSGD